MSEMTCKACGETFRRAAILALLIDAGARGPDPNYCSAAEDHEHNWSDKASEEIKEVQGG